MEEKLFMKEDNSYRSFDRKSLYGLEVKNRINIIHTDPIKWQPSNLSVDFSAKTLTKPSVSSFVLALLLAANGNLPTTYSTPYI